MRGARKEMTPGKTNPESSPEAKAQTRAPQFALAEGSILLEKTRLDATAECYFFVRLRVVFVRVLRPSPIFFANCERLLA